jgi:EmrB/QacA subfamily drug resistance transporter
MRWKILVISSLTIGIIFLDFSVLPLAITALQKQFDISNYFFQWLLNCYTLTIAASLLMFGKLSQYVGRKHVFCLGLVVFEIASLICAMSYLSWHLVLGRILQGLGAAMVMPTSSAIVSTQFSKQERGKAIGIYSSTGSIFFALGPLIGGFLTQMISWRAIFWINIPLGFLGLYAAMRYLPDEEKKPHDHPFDMRFAILWFFTISMIVGAIMQTQYWGWKHPLTWTLLSLGVTSLFLLIGSEIQKNKPFVQFKNFAKKPFILGLLCIGLNQTLVVMIAFWSIFLQKVLNFSPLSAGIMTLIAYSPVLVSSMFAGFLVDRFGPKMPVAIGFFLSSMALLFLGTSTSNIEIQNLSFAFVVLGLGIPMIAPASFVYMMHDMPKEHIAVASSFNNTFRQFFAALSIAIIGSSLYSSVSTKILHKINHENWAKNIPDHAIKKLMQGRLNPKEAFKDHLSEEIYELEALYRFHFEKGFSKANFAAACVGIFGLSVALYFYPKKRLAIHQEEDALNKQVPPSQDEQT